MDTLFLPVKYPICLQAGYVVRLARDFQKTKTGRGGSMNIQEAEEFKTSKFFCKTNLDMEEIKKEEAQYAKCPLPIFYDFGSPEDREQILYKNFVTVTQDVKLMIETILGKREGK
jgi:hypothetical protein